MSSLKVVPGFARIWFVVVCRLQKNFHQSPMSSIDNLIAQDIQQYGWACITVHDAEKPFAYTAGLFHTFQHPELIIFGRLEDDSGILDSLVAAIRNGNRIDEPRSYDLLEGFPIATRPVHNSQHELYFGFAMGFLTGIGRMGELEAVQVFVPDRYGVYPFQPNCSLSVYESQPRLDIGLTKSEQAAWRRKWR